MKKGKYMSAFAIVAMLLFVMLFTSASACAKEPEESPPGIQKNSGWTVNGNNLTTTYLDCNVGIGTTNPSGKLEVVGNIVVSGTVDGIDIDVAIGNLTSANEDLQDAIDAEEAARIAADNTLQTNINNLAAADALDYDSLADLEAAVANGFNIAATSGNVGIGTLSPSKKLHVAGSVLVDDDLEVDGDAKVSGELDLDGGIVSSEKIVIESTGDYIRLIAGDSIITIDPSGGITIESTGDISIESEGALTLQGDTVDIISATDIGITAGENIDITSGFVLDLNAGTNMNQKAGAILNIDGSMQLNMKSSGMTDIRGSLVNINAHLGGMPAARMNDPVTGFVPPPGGPLIGGRILMGSPSVRIG